MENEQTSNAYLERGIRGYGPTGLWSDHYDTPTTGRIGKILLIVVIILAIVAGAIIVWILWRKRLAAASTVNNTAGNNNNNGNNNDDNDDNGPGCSVVGCISPQVCNTTTDTCVECLSNTNCSGSTPFCDTISYTCKQCAVAGDCTGGGSCTNGTCCNDTAPNISVVTPTTSGNSQVLITYSQVQTGSGYSNVRVEVNIETPTGTLLKALVKTAAAGTVTVTESELALPNDYLFPGVAYQVRLRMRYDCGGSSNVNSAYSNPSAFTMPGCPATVLVSNQGAGNGADNPGFSNYNGVVLRFFQFTSPIQIGVLADPSNTVHPNLAAIYHPLIATTGVVGSDDSYQYAPVPYPGPVGSTNYLYYFNIGSGSNCNSILSGPVIFFRGF